MRNKLVAAWAPAVKSTADRDAWTVDVAQRCAASHLYVAKQIGMRTVYFTPIKHVKFVAFLDWDHVLFHISKPLVRTQSAADWCVQLIHSVVNPVGTPIALGRRKKYACFLRQ